jgi:DNA-binding transcriptional ArsR family regulator
LKKHEKDVTESLLSALSHPLRRDVLRTVIEAGTPVSPKELAVHHRVTIKSMSRHVKTLLGVEGVKLVDLRPIGGSVQHFYEPGPACERPLVRDAIGLGADEPAA